jgi:hypothetical protein
LRFKVELEPSVLVLIADNYKSIARA